MSRTYGSCETIVFLKLSLFYYKKMLSDYTCARCGENVKDKEDWPDECFCATCMALLNADGTCSWCIEKRRMKTDEEKARYDAEQKARFEFSRKKVERRARLEYTSKLSGEEKKLMSSAAKISIIVPGQVDVINMYKLCGVICWGSFYYFDDTRQNYIDCWNAIGREDAITAYEAVRQANNLDHPNPLAELSLPASDRLKPTAKEFATLLDHDHIDLGGFSYMNAILFAIGSMRKRREILS